MKIFVNVALDFNPHQIGSTHFSIDFNWMTETGIIAGGTNLSIPVNATANVDNYNQAIINNVINAINASGKYRVARGDAIILLGGFTTVINR